MLKEIGGEKEVASLFFLLLATAPQYARSPSSGTKAVLQVLRESGPRKVGQSLPGPVLVSQAGDIAPLLRALPGKRIVHTL